MKKHLNFMKKQLNFMKKQLNFMKSILWNFMKKQLNFMKKQLIFFMTCQWRKHNKKTNYFCENWKFSLKMIALILILVSKTSKSKAKWPEQASNVSKASKDRWRNQKFQHWKNRKRDLSRNSNQQQQEEDETAFRINEEIKKKCSWRSWNDVWRMVQSMERDESKVYHCGSLIAHIINWQTKQISNVISKAY